MPCASIARGSNRSESPDTESATVDEVKSVTPQRIVAGIVGMSLVAGGILAVFLTSNAAGSTSLMALGALVVGVAIFSDRIESLEFGAAKLKLRDLAKQRFALAAQKEGEGDSAAALQLRKQARGFQRLAGAYRRIRQSKPPGPERTELLDKLVAQARQLAEDTNFDPVDVWGWFEGGDEDARVISLGLMQGDSRLRDFYSALDAIESPRSPFEQYHALRMVYAMVDEADALTKLEKTWLIEAIARAQKDKRFRNDAFSMPLSERIAAHL